MDSAIDDFKGVFTLKQIENKIKTGCVTSIFRTARNFEEHLLIDGSTNGQTIYFSKSDVMIRFYDKYKERANKAIRTLVNTSDELDGFICGILR